MPRKLTVNQLLKKFPELLQQKENDNCLVDICCPECGNHDRFRIVMTTSMLCYDNGTDEHEDTEWDNNSHCRCDCGHEGKVRNFTFKGLDAEIYQRRP